MTTRPVLLAFSILTALQVLVGGALIGDLFGDKAAGAAILVVAAITAGLKFYVQSQVTPWQTVAAHKPSDTIVAGPAATVAEGNPVEVVPTQPPTNT